MTPLKLFLISSLLLWMWDEFYDHALKDSYKNISIIEYIYTVLGFIIIISIIWGIIHYIPI